MGVVVRPLEPADRDLVAAGFERLSPESRYRRFFAAIPRLTERQLDYLTEIDQHDHVALIAVDDATGEGVGVARFVRTGPGVAEPAVAVADDWQGRGVGSALLDRLVERAREEGVVRFVAPVLAENVAAIRSLERLGDTTLERHGTEVALTVALPDAPAPQSGVRRILRTLAADAVDPTLIFWHRLLPRAELAREQLRNVVLAGLDDRAVPVAGELAAAYGAALVIVAARNPIRGSAEELEARVERQAAPLRGRIGEVGIVVRAGDLGAILLDEAVARRARLIVVSGADADQGVAGRLLGRVWDHVSHHASCDVLVVR